MKALTWQGKRKIEYSDVPDPRVQEPTDIIGHEPMGIVEEVGAGVSRVKIGDRVVVPFNVSCGHCWMCDRGLQSQCETTQVRSHGKGAAFTGYSASYGSVPGGQAEYLRVPHGDYGAMVVGQELPDHRYLFLSDILPTAWQGVDYASVPEGGTLAVFGLGPVGQLAAPIGVHLGHRVIAIDPVPERREMAARHGVEVLDFSNDVADELQAMTDRGPDSILDAVGMEAHGSLGAKVMQQATGLLTPVIHDDGRGGVGTA